MSQAEQHDPALLARLLSAREGHVHLLGIRGIGMAGLAHLLAARRLTVSGCDLIPGSARDGFASDGIDVSEGHDPAHLESGVTWVVRSAAVPDTCPELLAARRAGLPVFRRGVVLPRLLDGVQSVAVGGTHGKTTTSAIAALMLRACGRDPSWCIGGEICGPGSVAYQGKGNVLVVEADESDGTLVDYHPDIGVVTNVEFDHMEHFAGPEAFKACFRRFAEQALRMVVYCADDVGATELCRALPHGLAYGLAPDAAIRAVDVEQRPDGSSFELLSGAKSLGRVTLPMPGRHNVVNALAACAVGLELGLTAEDLRCGLAAARLPRRRFDRVAAGRGVTVISDYAHHPSEVRALVQTASALPHGRLLAVFQPHRYSRTLALGDAFPAAFAGIETLVLTPVYAASEQPVRGGTVWDLYRHFRASTGPSASAVYVARRLVAAWEYLRRELREADVLLVIGAGDVERMGEWARRHLDGGAVDAPPCIAAGGETGRVCADEPLATKTTLRVGGGADTWVELDSVPDFARLLRAIGEGDRPFRLLGAGSNVLVSDLGVRGVVGRLSGETFRSVRVGREEVVVGGAATVANLLNVLQKNGLTGLEFLEGIPGTVGGCLAMNAGAWGKTIGNQVSWIRCLNRDGTECILRKSDVSWRYRGCDALRSRYVVEAGFRVPSADTETVRRLRSEVAGRRAWLRGKRSAGSVFKNPHGDYAGRLLEDRGLKGFRVGGACVCDEHANVIVTTDGATASDVLALIGIMRDAVFHGFGIELDMELQVWE